MCYLIIVALFMGLGKVYSLRGGGGDFKVIIWEASLKGTEPIFMGDVTPEDTIKYFNFAIG